MKKRIKVILIVIGVFVVLALIGALTNKDTPATSTTVSNSNTVAAQSSGAVSPSLQPSSVLNTPGPSKAKANDVEPSAPSPSKTVASIKYDTDLGSGNYTAGVDFPEGKYDIEAVSGNGNVSSDNMYDGGINAVMGTGKSSIYEQSFANVRLPLGTVLRVSGGVVIHISCDVASGKPLSQRIQKNTQTVKLKSGHFVAGEDFPEGVYDIEVVSGNGNVSSDNMYNGGINAVMGKSKNAMYEKKYKNIELTAGVTLSINGVTINLIPSK